MTTPGPDVSVRVGWADDAPAVAAVQVATWREQYAGLFDPDALPAVDEVARAWADALARPSDARNRVLVALERNRVAGFAVLAPAGDPDCDPVVDGELTDLAVAPGDLGRGHGSRLLQAVADTMAADRFTRAITWVNTDDDSRRRFLTGAGWAPDSAHRELDLDGSGRTTVKQVRLHTALA